MIITCYSIRSGFSNVMDSIVLGKPQDPDIIVDEMQIVLPRGYTLGESVSGQPSIYDEEDNPCEICYNNLRQKAVLLVSATRMVGAKKVPEGRKLVKLQEARMEAGLTAAKLAEISGVGIRQIQRVELGESEAGNLTARNLLALADALGVDPRELI